MILKSITFIKPLILMTLLGFMVASCSAQSNGEHSSSTVTKTVQITEVNGEKEVTITTIDGDNENVEVFTGKDADRYIQESDGDSKIIKMHVERSSDGKDKSEK